MNSHIFQTKTDSLFSLFSIDSDGRFVISLGTGDLFTGIVGVSTITKVLVAISFFTDLGNTNPFDSSNLV